MKRIRDTYGSARVYQNFSGTWKVELNLGGTLHYFNADTKEEAVEIANAQTNGGRVVIEDSKTRKSMKRVKDNKDYVEEPDTLVMYEGKEISYDMKCYDGYAIGECNEDGADIPKTIKMTYPKISELSEDEIDEVLTYRGLEGSVKPEDITYGDVMMAMGELSAEYVGDVSDSRKIKDAEETPDVIDGILLIAFDDGEEENGYNEVKKHANEQGTIDGVQYETYDTDYQDGATLIDLCAATDDANGFVKALLTEWGIIDEVVDIDFEMSDLMKGEVSDSKRVSDMTKPVHLRGYAERYRQKRREKKESYKENEEENQDKEVTDSRRIKDYVVGTKHPQEYFAELRWMLESLKKRGYIDAYLDDDIIKGFAEYYDYPSLRKFNEWGDEEVAAGFDEYLESLE